jgi:uncharacterized protein
MDLVLLFLGGVFGGFFGSMVGSAGLVSLPLLILMGQSPHQAVATTRPAAFVLELVSAVRYRREGKLDGKLLWRGLWLGIAGGAGGVIGSMVIASVSDQTLRLLFSIIMLSMFVLLLSKKDWGGKENTVRQQQFIPLLILTMLTGIYGGFFGFTFGTILTFVLAAFGYTLMQSASLARVVGALTTFSSTLVFVYNGTIHWGYAAVLSAGFAVGAWIGAGVGAKKGSGFIKIVLTFVIVASVAKLLWDFWRMA